MHGYQKASHFKCRKYPPIHLGHLILLKINTYILLLKTNPFKSLAVYALGISKNPIFPSGICWRMKCSVEPASSF